ncbi:unnamed protein product [Acanthoscelides obtectus]|uniref:Uncharacterized protein n=1 Tax=Acanthoscelides obtectus TaxID=200917 RepID=A0A9P0MCB3_ACAOB|nr:unnamed protein product [Acanthoscelides obtectus]CAK1676015.1 hypothetical protein AOBTE_LOCUS30549 [Acanthoscelides obtectus]
MAISSFFAYNQRITRKRSILSYQEWSNFFPARLSISYSTVTVLFHLKYLSKESSSLKSRLSVYHYSFLFLRKARQILCPHLLQLSPT